MATTIQITDYTDKVLSKFESNAQNFLTEAKDSIGAQAGANSPVDTGALRRSFSADSFVDKKEKAAYIGSSLNYAPYIEFDTGEYALAGNGRKGGWAYTSKKDGKTYFTRGNKPQRMLYRAVQTKKPLIANIAKQKFGGG